MKLYASLMTPSRRAFLGDLGLLVLRLAFGGLMALRHGLPKLQSWSEKADSFPDPIGVGSPVSLALAIGAELGCSILVVLGLGTRLALLPLMFTMGVAFLVIHGGDPFKVKELAVVYFCAYGALLLAGPGRFSLDQLLLKRMAAKPAK